MALEEEPVRKLARIDAVLALEPHRNGEQQTLVDQLDGEMHRSEEQEKRTLLGGPSAWMGNRLTGILGVLHFNPDTSDAVLLSAIKHYVERHGKPTAPAKDLSWLSEADRQALYGADDRFNRRLYRVLLMSTLAHHLREGTMNGSGQPSQTLLPVSVAGRVPDRQSVFSSQSGAFTGGSWPKSLR